MTLSHNGPIGLPEKFQHSTARQQKPAIKPLYLGEESYQSISTEWRDLRKSLLGKLLGLVSLTSQGCGVTPSPESTQQPGIF